MLYLAELLIYNPETEYGVVADDLETVHPSGIAVTKSASGVAFDINKQTGFQYKLSSVKFYIRKVNSPVGIIKAHLYLATIAPNPDYRIPTGVSLAESEAIAIEDLPTSMTLKEFNFYEPNKYIMTSRIWYIIVIQVESATLINATNRVEVALDTTDVTHYHNETSYANGSWCWNSSRDGIFYVYGEYFCSCNGQFNPTKTCLIKAIRSIIPEANSDYWRAGQVTGNWREASRIMPRNLPHIAVRFSNERVWGTYDTPETTNMQTGYRFNLFIFHSNCMEDGYDKAHYAYHVADRIKTGLFGNPSPIGWDIEMLSCNEVEPVAGAHRISRVVIGGRISIERVD